MAKKPILITTVRSGFLSKGSKKKEKATNFSSLFVICAYQVCDEYKKGKKNPERSGFGGYITTMSFALNRSFNSEGNASSVMRTLMSLIVAKV